MAPDPHTAEALDIAGSHAELGLTVDDFFKPDGIIARVKPDYTKREGQQEGAEGILDAIRTGKHYFGEFGTGFGKSFIALIPAIIEAMASGKRFVISTETIALQEQYFFKDLPLLHQALGGGFTFALAKGRSNYICRAKMVDAVAQRNLTPIQQWADKLVVGRDLGDKSNAPKFCRDEDWNSIAAEEDCERRACGFYGDGASPVGCTDCFVFEAIKKRNDAQIIVTNHTMFLLDLWLGNGEAHPILGDYDCAIIDEAHTLPEIAQQTWGSEFGPKTISRTIKQIEKVLSRSHVEGVFDEGYLLGYQMMEEEIFKPFDPYLKDNSTPLKDIQAATDVSYKVAEEVAAELIALNKRMKEAKKKYGSNTPQYDALEAAQGRLSRMYSNLLRVYGESVDELKETKWLSYLEPRYSSTMKAKYGVLHSKPITVAPLLNVLLFERVPSVIMISATLRVSGRFDFMRRELGVPRTVQIGEEQRQKLVEAVGESPFNYEENVKGYFPLHLPDPVAPNYIPELSAEIEKIIRTVEGKALILFTNNKDMNTIYDMLFSKVPYQCLVQGSMPKMRLLEEFKADVHSCLFATRSFFTGIDVPGDALSTVILVKVPFRVPSEPLFAARCALIKAAGGNDFTDYSLPLMILDVRQAFGRLIRTEHDKGVFALLDSRAMKKPYSSKIKSSLPAIKKVSTL